MVTEEQALHYLRHALRRSVTHPLEARRMLSKTRTEMRASGASVFAIRIDCIEDEPTSFRWRPLPATATVMCPEGISSIEERVKLDRAVMRRHRFDFSDLEEAP